MPLTRFLYMGDEVIVTFMECLLKRNELRECYFWISEYYYSGLQANTWQLLWQIFYDFYAIKYPKLEGCINKEYMKWKKRKTIVPIMNITSLFFERTGQPYVFLARHAQPHPFHNVISPPWLSDFPVEYHPLLLSFHHQCFKGIAYHMEKINTKDMYKLIIDYFKKIHEMDIGDGHLDTIPYNNKKHILWCLILHLYFPESKINAEIPVISVAPDDIRWVKALNEEEIEPLYRTLPIKRVYAISDTIGCFKLQRFDSRCPPMKRLLGFYWEYFASYTPLWRKRFRNYQAKRSTKKFEMRFDTDDNLEAFGEKYNYEPDEQSNETQDKSIREIKKRTPREWIEELFGVKYIRKKRFPKYL